MGCTIVFLPMPTESTSNPKSQVWSVLSKTAFSCGRRECRAHGCGLCPIFFFYFWTLDVEKGSKQPVEVLMLVLCHPIPLLRPDLREVRAASHQPMGHLFSLGLGDHDTGQRLEWSRSFLKCTLLLSPRPKAPSCQAGLWGMFLLQCFPTAPSLLLFMSPVKSEVCQSTLSAFLCQPSLLQSAWNLIYVWINIVEYGLQTHLLLESRSWKSQLSICIQLFIYSGANKSQYSIPQLLSR